MRFYVFHVPIIMHIIYRRLTNCRPNRLQRVQQVDTIIIYYFIFVAVYYKITLLLLCVFKYRMIVISAPNLTVCHRLNADTTRLIKIDIGT